MPGCPKPGVKENCGNHAMCTSLKANPAADVVKLLLATLMRGTCTSQPNLFVDHHHEDLTRLVVDALDTDVGTGVVRAGVALADDRGLRGSAIAFVENFNAFA